MLTWEAVATFVPHWALCWQVRCEEGEPSLLQLVLQLVLAVPQYRGQPRRGFLLKQPRWGEAESSLLQPVLGMVPPQAVPQAVPQDLELPLELPQ